MGSKPQNVLERFYIYKSFGLGVPQNLQEGTENVDGDLEYLVCLPATA